MKQARRETRRLKTYFGRVLREVERYVADDAELQKIAVSWLRDLRQIFEQQRSDSPKIYSVHEPQVECISKGKALKKYEFGCKISILVTHKQGLVSSQTLCMAILLMDTLYDKRSKMLKITVAQLFIVYLSTKGNEDMGLSVRRSVSQVKRN